MNYYFSHDGNHREGPLPAERLVGAGVTAATLVWREGMGDWQAAGRVPELAGLFAASAAVPAVVPAYQMPGTQQPSGYTPYAPDGNLGYASPAQQAPANGLAITSMVLGIAAWPLTCAYFIGGICAILAIIFGHIARGQIRRGQGSGGGMALAGLILGYIELLVAAVLIVFVIIALTAAATSVPRTTPAGGRTVPSPVTGR